MGERITYNQRRAIVIRLLSAWELAPEYNLGHLLIAATRKDSRADQARWLFYATNEDLVYALERFADFHQRPRGTKEPSNG